MKSYIRKFTLYLFGLISMGLGISLYIRTNIGVGSWDVLHTSLNEFYGYTINILGFTIYFSVGVWIFIVGIITILVSLLISFSNRAVFSILTGLLLGKIIDFWLIYILKFTITNLFIAIPLFFVALIFLGSGISLLILSELPPTPADVLMMSIAKRYKLNFLFSKSITESLVFLVAIIVGAMNRDILNNVGIGTIFSLLFIGSIVHYSSIMWKRLLIRN